MRKFELKPQAIEAAQFGTDEIINAIEAPDGSVYLNTGQGKVKLNAGDYVIGVIAGKQTVMGAAAFEARYAETKPAAKPKADKPKVTKKKVTKKVSKKKAGKK